jgi:hypothetical protein
MCLGVGCGRGVWAGAVVQTRSAVSSHGLRGRLWAEQAACCCVVGLSGTTMVQQLLWKGTKGSSSSGAAVEGRPCWCQSTTGGGMNESINHRWGHVILIHPLYVTTSAIVWHQGCPSVKGGVGCGLAAPCAVQLQCSGCQLRWSEAALVSARQ